MSWINQAEGDTPIEAVLAQRPELLERYRRLYQSLWADGAVPHRTLDLCRRRIAAIHDCEAERSVSEMDR